MKLKAISSLYFVGLSLLIILISFNLNGIDAGSALSREVFHIGDDKLAGESLRNTLENLLSSVSSSSSSDIDEVVLVCVERPGCTFDISGVSLDINKNFKLRGELIKGKRPVISHQGTPIRINLSSPIDRESALHFESLNFVADPLYPSDSRIHISGSSGYVLFDKVLFSGHNSGITGRGGAIHISSDSTIQLQLETVTFTRNGAELGGAIYAAGNGPVIILNSYFSRNIATEKGGAIYSLGCDLRIAGTTFKGNKATGSSMNVGRGGAIWSSGDIAMYETVSLGGNYAKYGQLIHMDDAVITVDGLVVNDDMEAIYLLAGADAVISRTRLRRGVICSDDEYEEYVERFGCGSDITVGTYCRRGHDEPEDEDDVDGDGISCVFDCNDLDPEIRPGVQEIANGTDSNCNGLIDEHIDTDGDGVDDSADECPEDWFKISPGICGCGLVDSFDGYNTCPACIDPFWAYSLHGHRRQYTIPNDYQSHVGATDLPNQSQTIINNNDNNNNNNGGNTASAPRPQADTGTSSHVSSTLQPVSEWDEYPMNEAFQKDDGWWYYVDGSNWFYYDGAEWIVGGGYR